MVAKTILKQAEEELVRKNLIVIPKSKTMKGPFKVAKDEHCGWKILFSSGGEDMRILFFSNKLDYNDCATIVKYLNEAFYAGKTYSKK